MILFNSASILRHHGGKWAEVHDWEQLMADHAFRPMPGTAIVVMQPPRRESAGGILLADPDIKASDASGRRIRYDWKESSAGTIVALGEDPRPMLTNPHVRQNVEAYGQFYIPRNPDRWPSHNFRVGDRVLVNRQESFGFRKFYIDTPGGAHFYADALAIAGRAALMDQATGHITRPFVFPLCRTMPMVEIEGRWRPTGDNILIYRAPMAEKVGSIVIPDGAKRRDPVGIILDVPDSMLEFATPGDEVLWQPDCQQLLVAPGIPSGSVVTPVASLGAKCGHRDIAEVWEEINGTRHD